MKTGKTLVITGAYEVDIKEYPVPEAADDGMVIQVEALSSAAQMDTL